ncbi:hypothetical protein AHAS_Ahas20G0194600 [Arachis hypogaea]
MTDYEQATQWGYTPGPQNDQDNFMGYCPTPQNDSCHYAISGWEYQQGMTEYEHLPETQHEPYFDEYNNYSSCGWEDQNQRAFNSPYSIYQEPSSLERTFNSFIQNCPTSPPSFSFENSSSLDYASTQSFLQNPYNSFH